MADSPITNALQRGSIVGAALGGVAFFGVLGLAATTEDGIVGAQDLVKGGIAFGSAFFTYLAGRLAEGAVDQQSPIQRNADEAKAHT